MGTIFTSCATVAAITLAAAMMQTPVMADEVVFTTTIPSGAIVPDIQNIGVEFAGFSHVGVNTDLCEVSFGDRILSPYLDYELMLVDGGAAFFGISFPAPLGADTPTDLSIFLNPGCVSLWNDPESEERVSIDIPVQLTYTVAPGATDEVAITLASVSTPNDKGELAFVVDGVRRSYNRFYLKADMPGLLAVGTEVPNVVLSGPDGYLAVTTLRQAYGTVGRDSYFYFDVEQAPSVVGEYNIVISGNAIADNLRLANPEFGCANPDTGITFKMVENGSGVEQVAVDAGETSRTIYTLDGKRVSPGMNHSGITIATDGTKILR